MAQDKPSISRLLSGRDQLTRLEEEQILAQVLEQSRSKGADRRRLWGAFGALVAASAGIAGLFWVGPEPGEFVARGGGPHFTVRCTPTLPCGPGGRLEWFVQAQPPLTHFAAFARRADGTILWYFPDREDGTTLDLSVHAQAKGGALDVGIELGQEHAPGTYKVIGMFLGAPLDRGQVRAAYLDPGPSGPQRVVVEAELELR